MSHSQKQLSLEGDKLIPFLPKIKVRYGDGLCSYFQTLDEAVLFANKNKLTIKESHPVKFDPDLFESANTDVYSIQALLNSLLFSIDGQRHLDINFFDKFYAFTQLISSIEEKVVHLKNRFEENYNILDHYKTFMLESR